MVEVFGEDRFACFPRKHLNKWSDSVVKERVQGLQDFLDVILCDEELKRCELFKDFLSLDEGARRQFYDPNSGTGGAVGNVEIKAITDKIDQIKTAMTPVKP